MFSESQATVQNAQISHIPNVTSSREVEVRACVVLLLYRILHATFQVASKFLSKAAEEEGVRLQVNNIVIPSIWSSRLMLFLSTYQQALSPRDIRWISRGLSAGEAGIRSVPNDVNQAAVVSSQQLDSTKHSLYRSPRGSKTAGMICQSKKTTRWKYFSDSNLRRITQTGRS